MRAEGGAEQSRRSAGRAIRWSAPPLTLALLIYVSFALQPRFIFGFDAMADWLFTRSAWAGIDPFSTSWAEQGLVQGITALDYGPASKTPATVIVSLPWMLVPAGWVPWVSLTINTIAFVAVCWLACRIAERRFVWWLSAASLALVQVSWRLGNPIFVWALLVLLTWYWSQQRDAWWVGVPLGIATAVRLWPGIMAAALWSQGRRKAALGAGAVAIGSNLVGLAAPGIDLSNSINGLLAAGAFWSGAHLNESLARLFYSSSLAVLVIIVGAVVLSHRSASTTLSSVASVLASPVTWTAYYLVAAPLFVKFWPWSLIPLALIVVPVWWLTPLGGVLLLLLSVQDSDGHAMDVAT